MTQPILISTGSDGRRTFQVFFDFDHNTGLETVIRNCLWEILNVTGYNDSERWQFMNLVYSEQSRQYSLIVRDTYSPRVVREEEPEAPPYTVEPKHVY